jgi:hypothetical protein
MFRPKNHVEDKKQEKILDIRFAAIQQIGSIYYGHCRSTKYLKNDKEYDEKIDPLVKIKNNLSMRFLFAVIYNLDKNNKGRKKDLLQALNEIINLNKQAGGYYLQSFFDKLINLINDKMQDNPDADFILPPENLGHISLVRNIVKVSWRYDELTYWFFMCSNDTINILKEITLNSLKILFLPNSSHSKWLELEELSKKGIEYDKEKWYRLGDLVSKGLTEAILPYTFIKNAFIDRGAGKSAEDLANIIMNYFDETPEVKLDISLYRYTTLNNIFFTRSQDEKTSQKLAKLIEEYSVPEFKLAK